MIQCGASLLQGLSAKPNHAAEQLAGDLRPLTQSPVMSADPYISNPDGSRVWACFTCTWCYLYLSVLKT